MRYTFLLFLLLPGVLAWGQTPRVTGAPIVAHAAAGNLDSQLRSFGGAAYWVGYSVAATPGEHTMCCWNGNGSGCGLEGKRTTSGANTNPNAGPATVHLEGPRELHVLYRVEAQQVHKVRIFSPDCQLDTGGVAFHWLTGVAPQASVQMLTSVLRQDAEKPRTDALAAIAFHADPTAETALEQLATAPDSSVKLRREGVFWLIQRGSKSGFAVVQRVAKEDREDKVREHAVFSLSQSKETQAVPTMIEVARTDKSAHVRGQALFWLAHKAGKQAAITDAIDRDPDTEIKKKAVFALTQMPDGAGVPKLIEVARSNGNPAVRKQAMFWLGQSKDPRALQFFEQVLR